MKIEWAKPAMADMKCLKRFIDSSDPKAALRIVRKISKAVVLLGNTPYMGRVGRREGTRELVITGTNYIVMYKVMGEAVFVQRVMHHAMRWPQNDDDDEGWFFL